MAAPGRFAAQGPRFIDYEAHQEYRYKLRIFFGLMAGGLGSYRSALIKVISLRASHAPRMARETRPTDFVL